MTQGTQGTTHLELKTHIGKCPFCDDDKDKEIVDSTGFCIHHSALHSATLEGD